VLKLDPHNANRGTDRGRRAVAASLEECGAGRSILVDRDGTVIAGNKTLEAAQALGLPVRVVESSGDELVVVQRTDLELDGEDQRARRLAYLDNRAAQLGLDWDTDQILADLQSGTDFAGIWDDAELDELLKRVSGTEGLTDPDDVPEVPEEATTQPGDLWLLAEHRLLCGDSTVATDVERLLVGGVPLLMVTDPPYGVQYDPKWRAEAGVNRSREKLGRVQNDDRADWREAWALFPGMVAYVWHSGLHAAEVQESLEVSGFEMRSQIIWAKDRFALSRGHYHWQHEPCWYAVRKGGKGHWAGDHSQTTVWRIPAREDSGHGHGTQKPVECMRRPIENNSSPGQLVYDPFLGSGTTLIAAEQTGRVCYGMEIDPRYCDVIVRRWEEFTGKKAVLDGDESHTQGS
jgi:DNA modification methylase